MPASAAEEGAGVVGGEGVEGGVGEEGVVEGGRHLRIRCLS